MTSTANWVFNPNVVNITLDPILCRYYSTVASTVLLGLAAEGSVLTYIPGYLQSGHFPNGGTRTQDNQRYYCAI